MAAIAFRGKDKVLKYFSDCAKPIWRVTLANDARHIVGYGFTQMDIRKAIMDLDNLLSSIEPDNVYSLETWGKDEKKPYGRADSVINFALGEAPAALGNAKEPLPQLYDKIGLGREMVLINENASLRSEMGVLKFQYEQAEKLISELRSTIVSLETDLDQYEAEDEDDEESVGSTETPADKLTKVAIGFLEQHGGKIVEHFTGKSEKIQDGEEVRMGAIEDSDEWKKYTIEQYCNQLLKEDPKLQYHLYRLLLIAQKKPKDFKNLLTMLENFS